MYMQAPISEYHARNKREHRKMCRQAMSCYYDETFTTATLIAALVVGALFIIALILWVKGVI